MSIMNFKPMLLPNDKAGVVVDWNKRLGDPGDWMVSVKDDGVRIEIFTSGAILSRSLKPFPSIQINELAQRFLKEADIHFNGVIEGEIYAPGMTLPEIIHFTRTKDVTDPKYRKKWINEWIKTNGGKGTYPKKVKGETVQQEWPFPGRDVDWLCSWHDEIQIQIFGCFMADNPEATMQERNLQLRYLNCEDKPWHVVPQYDYNFVDSILNSFEGIVTDGREGLVVMHRGHKYKQNRITIKEGIGYKLKETNVEFDFEVLDVLEATEAIPGAPKTTNELGRSVTSKLAEHRRPAGYAKGFFAKLDDGQTMTVSLNGYTIPEKQMMLGNKAHIIGQRLTGTGMKPVKVGGVPRSAHFTKGYVKKGATV